MVPQKYSVKVESIKVVLLTPVMYTCYNNLHFRMVIVHSLYQCFDPHWICKNLYQNNLQAPWSISCFSVCCHYWQEPPSLQRRPVMFVCICTLEGLYFSAHSHWWIVGNPRCMLAIVCCEFCVMQHYRSMEHYQEYNPTANSDCIAISLCYLISPWQNHSGGP